MAKYITYREWVGDPPSQIFMDLKITIILKFYIQCKRIIVVVVFYLLQTCVKRTKKVVKVVVAIYGNGKHGFAFTSAWTYILGWRIELYE